MIPAFTKPMTMTVVAPELWMAAVPTVPMPTPRSLLPEALENMFLRPLELTDSRLELIIWQATRKIPIPATSVRIAEIIVVVSMSHD